MRPGSVEKSFCTTKEAATLLGVSVGTVQLWVENGLLQAWKTAGGHRRVMRDSVERLLRKPSAADAPATGDAVGGADSSTPAAARRLRILVVEDDPALLRLYAVRLAAWPMAPEVEVSNNAFGALLSMGRACPDMLVTDLHMPGIDGFGMLQALQKAPEAASMRTVVVTGLDAAGIQARGGLPDGVEVLGKPVPFDRLQHIATSLVVQRQLQGAASATPRS